ncbi:MAG TPA: hypothetical protein PLI05_04845 [Methanotrichaceae archaeon]|nr:hypothetical protein [Methanotrichaceae archaeon]HQF16379.1 hypothetical protein [Methanotrichaceae archaeon]HQI91007.1 hypothetical protein [Methanotrichaceae archaeon]
MTTTIEIEKNLQVPDPGGYTIAQMAAGLAGYQRFINGSICPGPG